MKSLTSLPSIAFVVAVVCSFGPGCAHRNAATAGTPTALEKLQTGNERFATRPTSTPKPTTQRRSETATKQHPFAVIVACADSRVGPETIFDQTIGDLFVVREAGNLVDAFGLGSIEYAVTHLGARLVVVVGHQRCGAVSAAIAAENAPGHIGAIVRALQPAVRAARQRPGDLLVNATEINAEMVAAKIRRDADFGRFAPEVEIVTGYYSLDSGRVVWTKTGAR